MVHLIVPAAGLSTRYGLAKPKWQIQHPLGVPMIAAGLRGLRDVFSGVTVVALDEHLEGINIGFLTDCIRDTTGCEVEIVSIEHRTSSMVETIVIGLESLGGETAFCVKDTDNYVGVSPENLPTGENFIVTANLEKLKEVSAANKSFVIQSDHSVVTEIFEKKIVSNLINTGFVGFSSTSDFLAAALDLGHTRELYVSSVISELLSKGEIFVGVDAENYDDWGTIEAWNRYRGSYETLFVDLDGVLLENADPISMENNWSTFKPIYDNANHLLERQNSGKTRIVFVTARSRDFENLIVEELHKLGFRDFELLTGLLHAQRRLINDFAKTNPYPSAVSINLPRNSPNLRDYL